MGRVLPHEERLLTARAAIAIARKRHRPSAPTEVEGSRRLKSEDWLLDKAVRIELFSVVNSLIIREKTGNFSIFGRVGPDPDR